ncbi:MAG TPA: hypothetical protein VKA00_08360 [Trueperaceae bacterium]|nr:hypothetical protein [Trueperaceae bacterium]
MLKLNKIVRSTILALALLGFAGGAVAVTHAPSFTVADGGGNTVDAG